MCDDRPVEMWKGALLRGAKIPGAFMGSNNGTSFMSPISGKIVHPYSVHIYIYIYIIFFLSNATTCFCGLRGPPSLAWQQCLQLRCPDDVSGDIGGWSARRALSPKFY